MYYKDGYVYGGEPQGRLTITHAKPLDDMMMILTFSTGERRLFDATILTGPVFLPLQNPAVFKDIALDHGVVTWMNGDIDCAPSFMYEHSYEYSAAS